MKDPSRLVSLAGEQARLEGSRVKVDRPVRVSHYQLWRYGVEAFRHPPGDGLSYQPRHPQAFCRYSPQPLVGEVIGATSFVVPRRRGCFADQAVFEHAPKSSVHGGSAEALASLCNVRLRGLTKYFVLVGFDPGQVELVMLDLAEEVGVKGWHAEICVGNGIEGRRAARSIDATGRVNRALVRTGDGMRR